MSTTTGPRGPYAKTAAKREAIARAAYEIVEEIGHENLTTIEVAQRAGLSVRTVNYHFPTRDHLLVAAWDYAGIAGVDWTAELGRTDGLPSTVEEATPELAERVIRSLLRATAADVQRMRLRIYLVGQSQAPDTAAREYFGEHYPFSIFGLGNIMTALQRGGLISPDRDPRSLARQFLAAWDGLQQQWLVTQDFDLEEESIAAFRAISGLDLARTRAAVEELLHQI